MATHHGGAGHPLDRDDTPHGKDTEAHISHDYDLEETGDIGTIGQEHHTTWQTLLRNWIIYPLMTQGLIFSMNGTKIVLDHKLHQGHLPWLFQV